MSVDANVFVGAYLTATPPKIEYESGHMCPGCGRSTHSNYKFCPLCGKELVPVVRERTATLYDVLGDDESLSQIENVDSDYWVIVGNHSPCGVHVNFGDDYPISAETRDITVQNFKRNYAQQIATIGEAAKHVEIKFGIIAYYA